MTKFKLQSVLGYRKNLEEMAQLELAQARQYYLSIQQNIETEQEHIQDLRKAYQLCQAKGAEAMILILYQQSLDSALHTLHKLKSELTKAEQMVSCKKEALQAASTDKKLLQKLKERHEQRDRIEQERQETMFLDDSASACWNRNR